ncbi:MAG: tetratricopeptide repeat protein [Armatimonas sp.]
MEEVSRERAQALMREGELEGAVAVLKEVTTQNPGDAMAWQMMGAALGALGQTDDSIGAFQQAAELQPTSARVQFNLAVALVKSDRNSEARSHLEKALALDPGYEQARAKLKEIGGIAPDTVAPPPPDPTLGGGPAAKPVPTPAPPPPPAATPAATGGGSPSPASLGTVGAPAAPKPADLPPPAAAPAAPALQPIGGGLAPIGGVGAAPTPSSAPPAPGAPASGGMAGIGSIGGSASDKPGPVAPPPSAGPGGYAPPPGAYRPVDAPRRYAPDVNAGNILTMAIVSIFCFGLILGPYAIVKASEGLRILSEYPEDDQAPRGTLQAARTVAIIATVLSALGVIIRLATLGSALAQR